MHLGGHLLSQAAQRSSRCWYTRSLLLWMELGFPFLGTTGSFGNEQAYAESGQCRELKGRRVLHDSCF